MQEGYDANRREKAKAYQGVRNKLFLVDIVITIVILLAFQLSGASRLILDQIEVWCPNYYLKNAIYVACFFAVYAILSLPMTYIGGYYLEHYYELSNQKFHYWIWDGIKKFLMNLLFGIIAIEAIYVFLHTVPNYWWIWATLFYLLLSIVLSRIMPTVILPIFYKVKKLEDTVLVDRLIALAKKTGVKVLGVFQMNMSRKTKKANAMFTGWGKTRRIILGDTLLENFTHDEIEVILAHELGHYYYRHILKLVLMSIVSTLISFYIAHLVLQMSFQYFGLGGIDDIAGLPFFLLIIFIFMLLLMPLTNGFSRMLERQADRFALDQTGKAQDFISSMKNLASQNLSDENPHPLIEFFLYSHPSIAKRIKMAETYIK